MIVAYHICTHEFSCLLNCILISPNGLVGANYRVRLNSDFIVYLALMLCLIFVFDFYSCVYVGIMVSV